MAAGLEDQHLVARVSRQPVGEDAARGPRSQNDIVVSAEIGRLIRRHVGVSHSTQPALGTGLLTLSAKILLHQGSVLELPRWRSRLPLGNVS